jgi:hypothetical protein
MRAPVVHTFRAWCRTLDEALAELPDDENWPNELYRLLIDAVAARRPRLVMWTENDVPVGLIALLRDPRGVWEPVTQWVLPAFVGPARPGRIRDLVTQLPFCSRIAWWRMQDPAPLGGYVRAKTESPTYILDLTSDLNAYWKQTGLGKRSLPRARQRCERMTLSVNAPGATEWVLKSADLHWRPAARKHPDRSSTTMVAAKYLAPLGKQQTFTLHDGDKCVAGDVAFVHRRELVATCAFRDRTYDHFGVGNRLMDLYSHWAKEQGYLAWDLGGGFDYKARWAPARGVKATLLVSPAVPYCTYRLRRTLARARDANVSRVRRILRWASRAAPVEQAQHGSR